MFAPEVSLVVVCEGDWKCFRKVLEITSVRILVYLIFCCSLDQLIHLKLNKWLLQGTCCLDMLSLLMLMTSCLNNKGGRFLLLVS